MNKLAIIKDDDTGPALGVGATEESAWLDAEHWAGEDCRPGHKCIRIFNHTYKAIKRGNPDAPRP
jgi:hypothetical protein